MEVLLLQDIVGVGKKSDLIVVRDGYALNCLLPKRIALVATPTVRRNYAQHIRERAMEREKEREAQKGVAQALEGKTISFARKTTKTGKLYAAISEEQIAEALKEQHAIDVATDSVKVDEPIKATGTFTVNVVAGGQPMQVKVTVTAEESK